MSGSLLLLRLFGVRQSRRVLGCTLSADAGELVVRTEKRLTARTEIGRDALRKAYGESSKLVVTAEIVSQPEPTGEGSNPEQHRA